MLENIGAEVEPVEDGLECIKMMSQMLEAGRYPDAVLLDLNMPKMTGLNTAITLRRLGYYGPLIALTACRKPGIKEVSFEASFDAFLFKGNFKVHTFREMLRRLAE
jgi:CheY-like chemotaxis protein